MRLAEELGRSPAWLPLQVPPDGAVRLVRLDEAAYRAASFLDERLLALGYEQRSCALAELEAAAAGLAPQSHYIFHTGHVGSTLLSRLIGAHPGFFSLREPALLRALCEPAAAGHAALRLDRALRLLGRTWHRGQRAVIKVTSFVSELAEPILATDAGAVAIFMCVEPEVYLRSILAGPNSRLESRRLAPARLERLVRRLGAGEWRPDPGSEGEQIAMSWLCEMSALCAAGAGLASRIRWVNFERFLRDPRTGLQGIFQALGAFPASAEVEALVTGPLMRQYSKAPEHAYDAALRHAVLMSAAHEHASEIRRGMAWLDRLAAQLRPVAELLVQAARAAC
jgi:hypothetical protein